MPSDRDFAERVRKAQERLQRRFGVWVTVDPQKWTETVTPSRSALRCCQDLHIAYNATRRHGEHWGRFCREATCIECRIYAVARLLEALEHAMENEPRIWLAEITAPDGRLAERLRQRSLRAGTVGRILVAREDDGVEVATVLCSADLSGRDEPRSGEWISPDEAMGIAQQATRLPGLGRLPTLLGTWKRLQPKDRRIALPNQLGESAVIRVHDEVAATEAKARGATTWDFHQVAPPEIDFDAHAELVKRRLLWEREQGEWLA